jgi:natural product biosynthesis luciferase-like monooxygenase protein
VTSSGHPETFRSAGRIDANILTHLIGQDLDTLAQKLRIYRDARAESGLDPNDGTVTLMLHTFLGQDVATVKEIVRQPFREYLRAAVALEVKAAAGGGAISGGHQIEKPDISQRDMETLLDVTFERYFEQGSLMGTPASVGPIIKRLSTMGVDEIACLIDFLDNPDTILAGLKPLAELTTAPVMDDFESLDL